MRNKFASSVDQVKTNALALHKMGEGSDEERRFHASRVRNALHHVVFHEHGKPIFAPVKWSGAKSNSIASYPRNKDPVTDNFRRALRKLGFRQVSSGDAAHQELYDDFVQYCASFGFVHSKPGPDERHYHVAFASGAFQFAEELVSGSGGHTEGHATQVTVNRYERSSQNRQKCIDAHGTDCAVCDFNFFDAYGELGAGFIHVHHVVPVSQLGEGYEVDPIKDLVPVCPNCHAMLHKKDPPLTVAELRQEI